MADTTTTLAAVPALADVEREAKGCTRCPLAHTRTQVVFGVGNPSADLMFVGEAPGQQEDLQGEPFVGRSGQLLDRMVLEEMGLTREQFYIANTVKCRPPGNRDPQPLEIKACNPWLEAQVDLIDPKVVVTLGNFAAKLLLGTTDGITKLRGRAYPYRRGVLVPTFHPAAVLRGAGDLAAQMRADLVRAKGYLAA
ncbi:MAG: uracil-DNA glycosylase [Actinomycetota bacterium]|jgi:uracil-DNA glycosylase family 4|nr:uracil-DNA glycosylase [Actinomycetota bacterium]